MALTLVGVSEYLSPPRAILSGASTFFADPDLVSSEQAELTGTSNIFARLSGAIAAAAEIPGTSTIFARGTLNGEPNEFGSAILTGTSSLSANGQLSLKGKAVLTGTSTLSADATAVEAERAVCNVTLTVLDAIPEDAETRGTISARLVVDNVSYPIRSASYKEPRNAAGVSLQCILQRTAARDALAAADSFRFDIYEFGSWRTIFDAGRRSGGGFSFSFTDGKVNDELSISTIGPVSDKINKSPLESLTIYNPAFDDVTAAQFPPVYDTNGTPHYREIIPRSGLTLHWLLEYILVTRCGFTSIETDLPDGLVRRADFERTETFLNGLAPLIGAFDPLIFVQGGTVWILDSTQKLPDGFAESYPLTADKYRNAQFSEQVLNLDGYEVSYTDPRDPDYTTTREEIDDPEYFGTLGESDYTIIDRKRTFRDWYKVSNPSVVIKTEKISETETTRAMVNGTLLQVHESIENITLDRFGNEKLIAKSVTGLAPVLSTPGTFSTVTLLSERTEFFYKADRLNPSRKVLTSTKKEARGIICTDEAAPHLGNPWKVAFVDAARSGNLNSDMALSYGAIRTTVETNEQSGKGTTQTRVRTTDFLTTPPTVYNDTTDSRAGDASTNARGGTPQKVLVFRPGGIRSSQRIDGLSVGDLPLAQAIALARRRLANQVLRSGAVALVGTNTAIGRGFVFELFDREAESVGNFIVEGRSIELNNLGTPEQSTTQTLEVRQVQQNDS